MRTLLFSALICLAALPAMAIDLGAGKAQGLVGETPQGYIAAVKPTPEASALVADINARRRAEYQKISAGNGQPLTVVEKLAAQKLYEKAAAGDYLQSPSGQWTRK